jgi:hypothetical protein
MLDSGQVDLSAWLPDINRAYLGLLKHAFLAATLRFGILEGSGADAVRNDLLAARDARGRRDVPRSDLALGLTVLRGNYSGHSQLVWAKATIDDEAIDGVILGGSTFVSWSSVPYTGSLERAPLHVSLAVSARVEGRVSAPLSP